MGRLERYVLRETLGPLALGFLVYTFMLLVRFLFLSAEMIIERGVSFGSVMHMLGASLPNIVVLTLPMALLFGLLTAVGRLASDSELVAMRASGISLVKLYRPVLLISGLLTLANMAVSLWALPWGNSELQRIRVEILTKTAARQVEPRIFYEQWGNKVLYVFGVDRETNEWQGVFLSDVLPSSQSELTIAEKGRVRVDETGERVILELENAEKHVVDLNAPLKYQRHSYENVDLVLDDAFVSKTRAKVSSSRSLRELGLPELRKRLADPGLPPEQRNLALVELHKKFSIPFACFVFGLFALPLGVTNRRGGKSSGFALSMGVILVYYVLINNGEEAARYGRLEPWIAMWLPNVLLAVFGMYLLWRTNRDRGILPHRLNRWWRGVQLLPRIRREQGPLPGRGRSGAPGTDQEAEVTLRLPRLRLRFPNLLDRYTLRVFLGVTATVFLSVMSLFVLIDLSQIVDEIIKNQVSRSVVVQYYFFRSFQIFYEASPLVVLVSTLITFTLLSKTNEVTAIKALGISLYRLSVPTIAVAFLLALFSASLQWELLPATNQRALLLLQEIRGESPRASYKQADRWLMSKDGRIYHFLHFDPGTQNVQRLQIFELEGEKKLKSRLFTTSAQYHGVSGPTEAQWIFADGWTRRFSPTGGTTQEREYTPLKGPFRGDVAEPPEFFASELRRPEEMGYSQLSRYIGELRQSGQAVPDLEVDLHSKLAFPAVTFVMALVALPFAFRLGRQGTLYGIGLSIMLGMVFLLVLAVFTALGNKQALPPLIAVWSPSALFGLLAAYLFLGVRS